MFVSSRIFNQSSIIVFERELRFRSKGKNYLIASSTRSIKFEKTIVRGSWQSRLRFSQKQERDLVPLDPSICRLLYTKWGSKKKVSRISVVIR